MHTRSASLVRASDLLSHTSTEYGVVRKAPSRWCLTSLIGRLTEITGSARFSALASIVQEAQAGGRGVAWVEVTDSLFFPSDFEKRGIRVREIPIVMLPSHSDRGEIPPGDKAARAGEILLRSGAFSLVAVDLGVHRPGAAALARMLRVAGVQECAVVALTQGRPALGSLTSLRISTGYSRGESGCNAFTVSITAVKDKQEGPFWRETEVCYAPYGLC